MVSRHVTHVCREDATYGSLTFHVESFQPERTVGPPIVLVMGLGAQMLLWPDDFCSALAERGHHVVRFDNRDVGLSTRIEAEPPSLLRCVLRARLSLPVDAPYSLTDMARDTLAVIDALDLEAPCVVGASMGGMIAQRLALIAPERIRALVSVMSTLKPGMPESRALRALLGKPKPGREGYQQHMVRMIQATGSRTHAIDESALTELAGRLFDRGPSPEGFLRQFAAIQLDGDRTGLVADLPMPVLVIHGDEDSLIPTTYGIRSAEVMGAELLLVQGMGHDLPVPCWPQITAAISEHAVSCRTTAVAS